MTHHRQTSKVTTNCHHRLRSAAVMKYRHTPATITFFAACTTVQHPPGRQVQATSLVLLQEPATPLPPVQFLQIFPALEFFYETKFCAYPRLSLCQISYFHIFECWGSIWGRYLYSEVPLRNKFKESWHTCVHALHFLESPYITD